MKSIVLSSVAVLSLVLATPAEAQGWKDKLKAKAREKLEQAGDKAVDKATGGADSRVADPVAAKEVETRVDAPAATAPAAARAGETETESPDAVLKPGEGAWANYDFVPGERPLVVEDFSKDAVGDFPRRFEFKAGALEIVEWNKSRWLRATEDSRFFVVLPEVLPDRFTLEFEASIPGGGVWVIFGADENRRVEFHGGHGEARIANGETKIQANGRYTSKWSPSTLRKVRVMADGRYFKVYVDDKRLLNVPNADMQRSNRIQFYTDGETDKPSLFGNIRVMAGGKKLYETLAATGRVATQGILFDTGSDRIRPESTPTLKEIARMLEEHSELTLLIEGHTDDVGQAAANQVLSEKRAAAVKTALVESFAVTSDRLTTKGLGATKPAVPNSTPEGQQQNRRVELVKLQ
jgi:OmpA-OmpF porin, OOP family